MLKTARAVWKAVGLALALLRARTKHHNLNEDTALHALAARMVRQRGVSLKAAQVWADRSGNEQLRNKVLRQVPPKPLSKMTATLEREWRQPHTRILRWMEDSKHAASIGQVHKAQLLSGELVAVKIQYPGIEKAVLAELAAVRLVPRIGPLRRYGFSLARYHELLEVNFAQELDYQQEAKAQRRFFESVKVTGLVTPSVRRSLSTRRVLVQSWEDGEMIEATTHWPKPARAQAARILLSTFFNSLFRVGLLHTDPNSSNYLFRKKDQKVEVVLLDYGSTLELREEQRWALLRMIIAIRRSEPYDPLGLLVAFGFDESRLIPITDRLAPICALLLRPFVQSRPLDPDEWQVGERMRLLLGDLRWWFRAAGPPESMLLIRSFSGLVAQLVELEIGIPWWPILEQTVGPDTFAKALLFEPKAPTEQRTTTPTPPIRAAQLLRVKATNLDSGEPVIDLALPSSELLYLEDLVPEGALLLLQRDGLSVAKIVERAVATGFPIGELLHCSDDEHQYRLWLE